MTTTRSTRLSTPILALAGALLFFAGLAPSCSRADDLCALICECEHCNDIRDSFLCNQLNASQDIADTYDCSGQWDDWATCIEDQGMCFEEEARYTTNDTGSCTGSMDTGVSCDANTDCANQGFTNPTCQDNTCRQTTCVSNDFPCEADLDCPVGEDRCQAQRDALNMCIELAAQDDTAIAPGIGPS